MRRILLITVFCFISISFYDVEGLSHQQNTTEVCDTSFLHKECINDSILYLALVHYGVKHPKAVLAQAKLESGNFTSKLCVKRNNFLGLYNSRKKQFFHFNHWTECIIAYKDKVEYKLKDGENYYDFLERIGYAEDPSYINKVRRIENELTL